VLLELACWQPVQAIMGFTKEKPPRAGEVRRFRKRLLDPKDESTKELNAKVGDRFYAAIMTCIDGDKALGIEECEALGPEEDEESGDEADEEKRTEIEERKRARKEEKKRLEIELNVKLQRSFMNKVVDNLGAVVL
jgi:hypothetical protein